MPSFSDVDGEQSCAVHWEPPPEDVYKWRNKHPKVPKSLRIYECHIGISGTEQKISSFNDFVLNVNIFLNLNFIFKMYFFILQICFLFSGPSTYKRCGIQCHSTFWACWAQGLFFCWLQSKYLSAFNFTRIQWQFFLTLYYICNQAVWYFLCYVKKVVCFHDVPDVI